MTPEQKRAMVRQLLAGQAERGGPEMPPGLEGLPQFLKEAYTGLDPEEQPAVANAVRNPRFQGQNPYHIFEGELGGIPNPALSPVAPEASPRPQPAPPQKQMTGQPDGYQSVFSDLLPQEQQAIAQALQAGLSVEDAFAEVLGVDMNAISRGQ